MPTPSSCTLHAGGLGAGNPDHGGLRAAIVLNGRIKTPHATCAKLLGGGSPKNQLPKKQNSGADGARNGLRFEGTQAGGRPPFCMSSSPLVSSSTYPVAPVHCPLDSSTCHCCHRGPSFTSLRVPKVLPVCNVLADSKWFSFHMQ